MPRHLGKPPPERSNWESMNRGQQRYAIVQYNRALHRRGLPLYFNHSFDLGISGGVYGNENPPTTEDTNDSPISETAIKEENLQSIEHQTPIETSMKVDSSSGHGGKRPRLSSTQSTPVGIGTANNGDSATSGNSPDSTPLPIPSSSSTVTAGNIIYTKHHQFLSYGVSWRLVKSSELPDCNIGTTSLAEIPVTQLHLYMSKHEFDMLPPGAYVKRVTCSVTMHNPRVAFQTASTTSDLATLNQNKYVVWGEGLNRLTNGFNFKWSYDSAKPMKITDAKVSKMSTYDAQSSIWYGHKEMGVDKFAESLPTSFFSLPSILDSYFGVIHQEKRNNGAVGWPVFDQHLKKFEATNLVGKKIIEYSYEPDVGLLNRPPDAYWTGVCDETNSTENFSIQGVHQMQSPHGVNIMSVDTTNEQSSNVYTVEKYWNEGNRSISSDYWNTTFKPHRYHMGIELGHYIQKHPGETAQTQMPVQPSLHVGIMPVPKLTTTLNTLVPTDWQNVEITWDVTSTIEIGILMPTSLYSFAPRNNTSLHEHYYTPNNYHMAPMRLSTFMARQISPYEKNVGINTRYDTTKGGPFTAVKTDEHTALPKDMESSSEVKERVKRDDNNDDLPYGT